MKFEDAVPGDAPALVALINAAYRPPGAAEGWTHEGDLLDGPRIGTDSTQAAFETGRFLLLRPSSGASIEGCIHIAADDDGAWYLSLLAVSPARQAKGVGAALLAEAERQARHHAVPCLRISVIQHRQTLIAWYRRRGFHSTGASMPFPYNDRTVGRPLRDDLLLVLMEKALTSA